MEWVYARRRGPEWKQGWTGQTLASISAPPLHLIMIFGIVVVLLWLSQYTGYRAQVQHTAINLQLLFIILPMLVVLWMAFYSTNWLLHYKLQRPQRDSVPSPGGSFPWSVAIFVGLLLVLVSYQSSFHSKWFGPLQMSR